MWTDVKFYAKALATWWRGPIFKPLTKVMQGGHIVLASPLYFDWATASWLYELETDDSQYSEQQTASYRIAYLHYCSLLTVTGRRRVNSLGPQHFKQRGDVTVEAIIIAFVIALVGLFIYAVTKAALNPPLTFELRRDEWVCTKEATRPLPVGKAIIPQRYCIEYRKLDQ